MALDGHFPEAPYTRNAFTSYSLNFEDVMLHRLFAGRGSGFYVDVGAGHPRFENDTFALYEAGWRGINVEPNRAFFHALEEARPGDRNLCVALSDKAGGEISYHEIPGTGLSTCDAAVARAHEARGHEVRLCRVPVSTLADILDEADAPAVDVLKVDVEGLEERVLAGNDWERFRPKVVLVEATFPESPKRRLTGLRLFLEARGYRHVYFDGLNDFYLEQTFDDRGVLALPPNIFDGFTLREIVDLRAAVESLQGEFRSAQTYVGSLEAARATESAERTVLVAEHTVARGEAAALEAALTTLLRSGHPLSFRRIAPGDSNAFLARFSGGNAMDSVHGPGSPGAGAPALAVRLAAAQVEGLEAKNLRLEFDLDDAQGENRRLRAAVAQMHAEILTLSRALEPMHRLNEELAGLRVQVSALAAAECHWADAVRQQADAECFHTDAERRRADAEHHQADAERQRADAERQRADAGHHRADAERRRADAEARRAEQTCQYIRAIYSSSSWRLTRPWRAFGRLLKRQRGGDWRPL